jgi:tetratricopeptide (TPR) repeat protein
VAAMGFWRLVWPRDLSSDYSYNQIPLFEWQLSDMENIKAILAALLIAGTLALAAWCYKRNKAVSFLILLAWIAYGPTSNFLASTGSIMGDRFFYLPSVAFCGLLVIAVDALARRLGGTLELSPESFKRPWPRLLPHAVLLLITVLYAFRTYHRNFDWRSDVSLAEAAMKVSPGSFRAYGKLAEAYYQADPINNVDRIIELANKGVAIVDPLPNHENGIASYLTLGIYYGLKGERLSTRSGNGMLMMNDQSRAWFEKSVRVLERGSEIDLASNAIHHAREQKRGKTNIPDVGQSELYLYLGMSYERLGLDEKALEAYKYMRHLFPMDPQTHLRVASTQLNLGRLEDAAVSLLQCLIADPDNKEPWPLLSEIYSRINQEPIPAVQPKDGQLQLREDNKLVQRHLFLAYTGFMHLVRLAEQREILRQTREVAENHYHFDSRLIDEALNQPLARPTPPAPVFHTFGKKLADESTDRSTP